jgi:hypothetical protein
MGAARPGRAHRRPTRYVPCYAIRSSGHGQRVAFVSRLRRMVAVRPYLANIAAAAAMRSGVDASIVVGVIDGERASSLRRLRRRGRCVRGRDAHCAYHRRASDPLARAGRRTHHS